MMMWLACLLAVGAHFTHLLWKATLEREVRWNLYRVRDELRWAGIQNPDLLNDPRFWKLDDSLTLRCRHLHKLSVWPMLVIAKGMGGQELASLAVRSSDEAGPFLPFYEEAARLTMQHLRYRHVFLGRVGLNWFLSRSDHAPTKLGTAADYLVTHPPDTSGTDDWKLRSRVKAA